MKKKKKLISFTSTHSICSENGACNAVLFSCDNAGGYHVGSLRAALKLPRELNEIPSNPELLFDSASVEATQSKELEQATHNVRMDHSIHVRCAQEYEDAKNQVGLAGRTLHQ